MPGLPDGWAARAGGYVAASAEQHESGRETAIALSQAVFMGDVRGAWMLLREYAAPARGGELLDVAEWLAMLAGGLAGAITDSGFPDDVMWADVQKGLTGMPEAMRGDGSLWRLGGWCGESRRR